MNSSLTALMLLILGCKFPQNYHPLQEWSGLESAMSKRDCIVPERDKRAFYCLLSLLFLPPLAAALKENELIFLGVVSC